MVCARRACFSSVSGRTQTLRKRGRIQSKLRRTALCYSDRGGGWMQHHLGGGGASPLAASRANEAHWERRFKTQTCTTERMLKYRNVPFSTDGVHM